MAGLLHERPDRVLAVYAHPDDLEISCGGTLATWIAGGTVAAGVICTQGEKGSSDVSVDPVELAARRSVEAQASAAVLGAERLELLGYPDGSLTNDEVLRGQLVRIIRQVRPDCVIFPDPTATFFGSTYVNHHDHREVGWATLDACAPAAGSPLYYPEAGPAHAVAMLLMSGTLQPDAWVDITSGVATKAAAVRCHASQLGDGTDWVEDLVRRRAAEEGVSSGVPYAESFRLVRPSG